jgi:quercetin dioxygenase-like cupin family protein
MSARPHQTATITELENAKGWAPVRRELGVESFGINGWTAREAGASIIPEHDEKPSGHEELYLVIAGRATFTVAGEEIDAPEGTIVFVPDPGVLRAAVAAEAPTTVVSVGGEPGRAYAPRSWETNVDVMDLFEQGKHEEAREALIVALDQYEDRDTLLYNLACAEALLGRPDEALGHLREGVANRPDLAEAALTDEDLESLRDLPGFAQAVGRSS